MKNNLCVTEGKNTTDATSLKEIPLLPPIFFFFLIFSPGSDKIYYTVYVLKENDDKLVPVANPTFTTEIVVFMEVVKHAVVSRDVWQCLPQAQHCMIYHRAGHNVCPN